MQEAARKVVEMAFGVLQTRWRIVRGGTIIWDPNTFDVMACCVILELYLRVAAGIPLKNILRK